jgi:hypothetical protein
MEVFSFRFHLTNIGATATATTNQVIDPDVSKAHTVIIITNGTNLNPFTVCRNGNRIARLCLSITIGSKLSPRRTNKVVDPDVTLVLTFHIIIITKGTNRNPFTACQHGNLSSRIVRRFPSSSIESNLTSRAGCHISRR